MVAIPIAGLAPHPDGRHLKSVIFGTKRQFRQPARVTDALRSIRERLAIDPESWSDQRHFFRRFFRSFFRDAEGPAWVQIAAGRQGFHERIADGRGIAVHDTVECRELFDARYLGHEHLRLGDALLGTRSLRMRYRYGVPSRDLRLFEMTIRRTIGGDGLGPMLLCSERWTFLGSRCPEERLAREEGRNLTQLDFPARSPDGRTVPLVSLCRISPDRCWILNRVVSLTPGSGEVIEFRISKHPCSY